ncbi:MAG TPA: class I SAM-dependent methyltransferase [Streptosporangiaceae bacterium]|nr:class I SAM-dependent methyltransferase [Streptosporangiaceae bacterium]
MSEPDLLAARAAYDAVAALYADQFKDMLDDRPVERGMLAAFAEKVIHAPAGPVVDLGCGPGHIAAHLHGLGLRVLGVDQSAGMLAVGSARYPGVRFALGSITMLGLAGNSCSGVLSRSSVIHLPPALLSSALTEFARVLVPGGWLLLSFSATDGPVPPYEHYDHRVAGAYRWWPDHVVSLLQAAGVTETARLVENPEPEDRRQFRVASILAQKRPPHPAVRRPHDLRPGQEWVVPHHHRLGQSRF